MKQFLAILLCVVIPVVAFAATEPPTQPPVNTTPATKMEAFKPKAGSVMTVGFDELGEIKRISVDVREIREARGTSVRGLVIHVTESQYREGKSFVDADEIRELLKGFDALLEVRENPTQFKNFEVRYTTRGELELTAFNDSKGNVSYAVKAGRTIGARAYLTLTDMQNLRILFDSASQKLTALESPK